MENTIFSFFVRENRRRGIRDKFVRVMASVVVFCTTYSLILPALTMQPDAYCGTVEHEHSESCYVCTDAAPRLQCTDAMQIHEHTDSCRDAAGDLVCGCADFVLHTHDSLCYNDAGDLICTLPQHMPHVHSDACYESAVHTHGDSCYEIQRGTLLCSQEETEGHAHADSCYGPEEVLLCTAPETDGHAHGENCYQTETALSCGMESHPHNDSCYSTPELLCGKSEHAHKEDCYTEGALTCTAEEHAHGSDCYSQKELVCGQESHPHTDACYTQTQALVCGQEACEAHTHGDDCYGHPLVCQLEEIQGHQHTDACYEEIKTLVCQQEETAAEPELVCGKEILQVHTHDDSCRDEAGSLICGLLEVAEHTHTEDCLAEAGEMPLTCTLAEDENHQHSKLCYGTWVLSCGLEAHTHSLSCYSDPEADLETEEIWKRTFAAVELTGSFADDLAAIARTQNGYTESNRNYLVQEDGIHINGYTRYGAWAGEPYADWNAHFAAFCVNYAEIPEAALPTAATAGLWAEKLVDEQYNIFRDVGNYLPKTGDLVFLHMAQNEEETQEEKQTINFMGIVLSCTETAVTYIAGDSDKQVQVDVLPLDDAALLGYGRVFSVPMAGTKADGTNDLGAGVTVNCLNSQGKTTESYSGLEPFELQIEYGVAMEAGETYTLQLNEYFVNENTTVEIVQFASCNSTYDSEMGTFTFTPTDTAYKNGRVVVKGTIDSYAGEALVVSPVTGNSKTVTITKDPAQLQYTGSIGSVEAPLAVTVDLLEPNPAGSMNTVHGVQLVAVSADEAMYNTMVSGEKSVIGNDRIYEHKMFTVQFVDENGNVVEGLDLSSRDVTFTVAGTENMKGAGNENTQLHIFYRDGNNIKEATVGEDGTVTISGSALTDNAFMLDVITVNPDELAEGNYDGATFGYNNMRDAFIHDPKYAQYYNENSPLGTAGSFHLVAFGNAYLNSHTNGNILAYNLYAYNNFGTNQKDGYDGFSELHYVQNYEYVNANSSARDEDILVIGSEHTMSVINGNEFEIDRNKIGKPKNVIQDDDTNVAPFIDLHRVESEIRAISANLGSYGTIEDPDDLLITAKQPEEFIIATELIRDYYGPKTYNSDEFLEEHKSNDPYLKILNKDNIGVWNATPAEIQELADKGRGLAMKGFESGGSGAIIVNVDMSTWPDNQILELPDSRVYVDGKMESVSETLDFSAGKVIWNFTNADGKQIKTKIMTGMVVAPGATVTISQNLNGTVVAENIDVKAESHRTDFVGKIYKNEFREDAHIHIHKVDKGNFGKLLSGAKFQLEKYVGNGNWEIASYVEEDDLGLTNIVMQEGITDSEGKYLFENLEYNTVYRLTETEAPAGYVLDTTPRYFYYEMAVEGETELPPKPDNFSSLNFVNTTAEGECVHYHFTNTEDRPEITSIRVVKSWEDTEGKEMTQSMIELVYFKLYQVTGKTDNPKADNPEYIIANPEGTLYGTYPVTAADNWESTVANLPSLSADKTYQYSYYIKEVSVPGYNTIYLNKDGVNFVQQGEDGKDLPWSILGDEDGVINIVNQMDEKTTFKTLSVKKEWDGGNAGMEQIEFDLFRTTTTAHVGNYYHNEFFRSDPTAPVLIGTYSINASSDWQWVSELLPYSLPNGKTGNDQFWGPYYEVTNYEYQIVEHPIEGYTPEYSTSYQNNQYTLTINNVKDETTSISVTKVWRDENGNLLPTDKIPDDGIQVQLQRMSESVGEWEDYGDVVTIGAGDGWKKTFDQLPAKDPNGYFYKYRVVEAEIEGYGTTYDFVVTEDYYDGAAYDTVTFYGSGSVVGANPGDTVPLKLQQADKTVDNWTDCDNGQYTVTLDKDLNWNLTVENLNKAYRYRVVDGRSAEAEAEYTLLVTEGFTRANLIQKVDFSASGTIWYKNYGYPPYIENINVQLVRTAPGMTTDEIVVQSQSLRLGFGYNWNYEKKDLDAYNADGMPYTYKLVLLTQNWDLVVQNSATVMADNLKLFVTEGTITNTKLETTSIDIEKVWIDAANQPMNPEGVQSITVQIYREHEGDKTSREAYGDPITITPDENGKWSYSQDNLPKTNSSGTPWSYTVEEQAVPGYITSYGEVTTGEDGKLATTITNKARTGFTHIGIKKIWDLLDENAELPEDASVTVALYQRAKRADWEGDTYVDTATAETIPVNFNFNGTTYTVNGYPGETVVLFMNWQKEYDTDDVNNAYHNVTPKTGKGASVTPVESEHKPVESGHQFKFEFAIPENVEADGNGNKYINIEHGMGNNNRWTYDSLVVVPNGRVSFVESATLSEEANSWTYVKSPLPASEEIGGITVDYTYFVEETEISGFDNDVVFTTTYENNEGINGGDITITNSQKDIYTDLSVNKVWNLPEGATVPESVTYELHQVANTVPGDAGEVEMVDVHFEIARSNGELWNHAGLKAFSCPKGSLVKLTVTVSYDANWAEPKFSTSPLTNNETAVTGGWVDGLYTFVYETDPLQTDTVVYGKINTGDLNDDNSPWNVTVTADSSVLSDEVVGAVTLTNSNWTYTHSDLPTQGVLEDGTTVYYSYYVKETMVGDVPVAESGFIGTTVKDASGNITITNMPDNTKTSLTVKKEWDEGEGVDASTVTHGDVTVNVYRTTGTTQDPEKDEPVRTLTFGEAGGWTATADGLDIVDADGKLYTYYVAEVAVTGYTSSVTVNETDDGTFSFTVTNTAKEEGYTSVTVNKEWKYTDGSPYTPSDSDKITLKLMQVTNGAGGTASGTEQVTFTLNIENTGAQSEPREITVSKDTYVYFEIVTAGNQYPWVSDSSYQGINYKSMEQGADGYMHFYYEYKVKSDVTCIAHINTYNSSIYWDVILTGETSVTEPTERVYQTITLSNESGWTHTFSRLPENDGNGTTYSYYVVEENGEMYDVQYSGGNAETPVTGGTITVINTVDGPSYELPHTGGCAAAVYLLGWMMTAGAGIGLVSKKRRKSR